MAAAKRAVPVEDDAMGDVVDLGTVQPGRRAQGPSKAPRRVARYVTTPLALLAVVGLTLGAVDVSPTIDQADPAGVSTTQLGTSRDLARAALPSPSASPTTVTPSASPSAVSPSASPSATASVSAVLSAVPSATATATAKSTPKSTPTPTPTPTPVDYQSLGAVAGTQFATAAVYVRTGPGKGFDTVTTLAEDEPIAVTKRAVDGWQQVVVSKKSGWVKASFLTAEKPVVKTPTPASTSSASASGATGSSGSGSSGSGGASTAQCAKAGDLESHLTSRTVTVLRTVCAKFDGVSSYGGYRPGAGSYHGSGQAIDVMVSGDYGQQIADWARANASSLGIIEVIYEQKIWTTQRAGEGWRAMSDRGSVSANHYDHVHISVG